MLSRVLKSSCGLRKGESVLIVADPKRRSIGEAFRIAALKITDRVVLVEMPVAKYDSAEPPLAVAKAMKRFDVVLCPTTRSLTHTKARKAACAAGARVATLPGIVEKMLPTLDINYATIRKLATRLMLSMKSVQHVRVTSPSGTDVAFSLRGRAWDADVGDIRTRGSFGNLPAGEVSIAPLEGTSNGIVVIDSYGSGIKTPVKLVIKKGNVLAVGGKGKAALEKIFRSVKNSRNIAEFGIGINPKAREIGNTLNDEKVLGTVHFAIGSNISYGGRVYAGIHLDGIVRKPTIVADSRIIMRDGKL